MSLTVEVWRPWEVITANRFGQLTDKSFRRWHTGKCFLCEHHRSEGNRQSVSPEPASLKSLPWYSKTGEKRCLLSKVFSFCHELRYNSFQVPEYKILEIFYLVLMKTCILLGTDPVEPDFLTTSLSQDMSLSSSPGVKFASLVSCLYFSSSARWVGIPRALTYLVLPECTCWYTPVS